jgi:hypothetical protein
VAEQVRLTMCRLAVSTFARKEPGRSPFLVVRLQNIASCDGLLPDRPRVSFCPSDSARVSCAEIRPLARFLFQGPREFTETTIEGTPFMTKTPKTSKYITDPKAVIAVYNTHEEAESAVKELQKGGFDMKKLSVVGKDYHTEEDEHSLGTPAPAAAI